ncbi:ROK family protein [Paenibacillus sp.]|uniref:ROK family protein n=1 Tax=Paenibacillus sp. TaxID=58172 RepID=UPI002D6F9DF1|nr:ROK family protein [Paenibacillus sp.]HZG57799.1 ROK family protein [Paenibacillus sp.]
MHVSIGVDIGGTNTVIGLVDGGGRVAASEKIPTRAEEGPDALFDRIAASAAALLGGFGVDPAATTVGIGVPGFVDREAGISLLSGNLQWRGVPVAREVERRLGAPTAIDNDVRLYVYGEAMAGAGRGAAHVLGVTVGTGLAAALVTEGRLFYGSGGMAGELGHLRLDGIPYRCGCGLTGCLETVASATGIVRQARALVAAGRASVLRDRFPESELRGLTAFDVSRAYDDGDDVAREVLASTGRWLGRGLAYAVTLFSPDRVIVGGGAAAAGERLLEPVRREMEASLIPDYWARIDVVPASLGDEAGVIGSAMYGRRRAAERRA